MRSEYQTSLSHCQPSGGNRCHTNRGRKLNKTFNSKLFLILTTQCNNQLSTSVSLVSYSIYQSLYEVRWAYDFRRKQCILDSSSSIQRHLNSEAELHTLYSLPFQPKRSNCSKLSFVVYIKKTNKQTNNKTKQPPPQKKKNSKWCLILTNLSLPQDTN